MSSFFEKRIPTTVGLLLLAVAVLLTSYLVNTGVIIFGHAAPTDNPEDVQITNVSDTSFTVTYKTEAKVIGTISLANLNNTTQTILDDRDQESGVPNLYTIHSISVKNAKPSTTYSFSITSGTTTYQNNGTLFSAKTTQALTASPSAIPPLTGQLLDDNGTIPTEALVFVTTPNGQSLSTLTNEKGIYIIPLNAMRTSTFTSFLPLSDKSVLQVLATDGAASTQAQVLLESASPVPLMTLGNNYNFVTSTVPIASTAASLGFPPYPTDSSLTATPIIITPKKDEGFTDSQPEFSGKALPNETVDIQIHSDDAITATTQTDSNGSWTYRPTTPLSVGTHILSITTKNAAGILQTIQQSFTVFASGSQVTQSATPSGQLSPTPTPTPTPTPKPTAVPTSSGTSPTPTTLTPTPTVIPTVQPSTAPTTIITPKPTLPPTGSNTLVISSVLGIVTTLVGIVLFVLTKGVAI